MPELPEVEIVRRRLWPCLGGLVLSSLEVLDPTVSRQPQGELAALLVGGRVTGLRRRGKYLIVEFGDALLVVHLRMTGQLLFAAEESERRPRLRLEFAPATSLYFYDVRRFGRVWALRPQEEEAFLAGLGVEPLDEAFTPQMLRTLMAGRRAPLKAFLLDQRRVAGVGNIYADEALFRAGLHPLRPAGDVGPREAQRLHAAIVTTLQLGIEHEGSSVESFVDPAGERGHFQEILSVYQRTGEPCRVCGTTVARVLVSGRGTHYCPHCQPRRFARRRKTPREAVSDGEPDAARTMLGRADGPPSCLYVVAAWVPQREPIAVGSLGPVEFARGWYAYVGSARRGRRARVARHMRATKPLRWHADYLFARRPATRSGLYDGPLDECELVDRLLQTAGAARGPAGFGAGDCRCGGHLVGPLSAAQLKKMLASLPVLAAEPAP